MNKECWQVLAVTASLADQIAANAERKECAAAVRQRLVNLQVRSPCCARLGTSASNRCLISGLTANPLVHICQANVPACSMGRHRGHAGQHLVEWFRNDCHTCSLAACVTLRLYEGACVAPREDQICCGQRRYVFMDEQDGLHVPPLCTQHALHWPCA